jgi:hypothetical protein
MQNAHNYHTEEEEAQYIHNGPCGVVAAPYLVASHFLITINTYVPTESSEFK